MLLRRFLLLLVLSSLSACFDTSDDDDDDDVQTTPPPTPMGTVTPSLTMAGEIETHDFGTHQLPAGSSPVFQLTIPSDAIGIDLLAIGGTSDQNKAFYLYNVIAPGNRVLIDNTTTGPIRQYPKDGAASVFFPADDSNLARVEAGTWVFQVAAATTDFVSSSPRVLAKVRRRAGGVPNGRMDLNIFIVPGSHGFTAATASQAGSDINLALAHMQALWNTIGVEVFNITWWDITQDPSDSYQILESQAELGALLTISDDIIPIGGIENRVHMFLIDDFAGEYSGGVAGIAGGIPAPMDYAGTKHSGIVVAYGAVTTIEELGEVMAHEAAHSLGLYHTTEFTGTNFDPISDTSQCNSATMSSDPSSCPDYSNSMFPAVTGFSAGFSAGQGTVLRPSVPVYTHPGFTSRPGTIETRAPFASALPTYDLYVPRTTPAPRCGNSL